MPPWRCRWSAPSAGPVSLKHRRAESCWKTGCHDSHRHSREIPSTPTIKLRTLLLRCWWNYGPRSGSESSRTTNFMRPFGASCASWLTGRTPLPWSSRRGSQEPADSPAKLRATVGLARLWRPRSIRLAVTICRRLVIPVSGRSGSTRGHTHTAMASDLVSADRDPELIDRFDDLALKDILGMPRSLLMRMLSCTSATASCCCRR